MGAVSRVGAGAPTGVLIVTGTGTGVGKTVVTAAIAALAGERALRVAVVKPGQTGVGSDEPGDLDEVCRLSGVEDLHEHARYPDPLAPEAAARMAGLPPVDLVACAAEVVALAASRDLVLVEGSGGLLVRFGRDGATVADLARALGAPTLVVVTPDLGTLNHTTLTLEALERRDLALAGLVIGSWPDQPDLACRSNLGDLESVAGRPLSGAVPSGAGRLDAAAFLGAARAGLAPELGGAFDAADFRHRFDPVTGPKFDPMLGPKFDPMEASP